MEQSDVERVVSVATDVRLCEVKCQKLAKDNAIKTSISIVCCSQLAVSKTMKENTFS